MAALERLYNSTGGSAGRWNFTSMKVNIKEYATKFPEYGFLDLSGAAWDFKKNAAGSYEVDPCVSGSSGNNFAGIGCACSASNECSITQVGLPRGKLAGSFGSVVAALQDFTQLSYLDAGQNALNGTIPSALGDLTQLQLLYLEENALTGRIPKELGNLAKLHSLDVQKNSLAGQIPSEIGRLTSLTYFMLYTNPLNGTIPSEMGSMTSLKRLAIFNNSLIGSIPEELGKLTNLDLLYLFSNSLTGTLPSLVT